MSNGVVRRSGLVVQRAVSKSGYAYQEVFLLTKNKDYILRVSCCIDKLIGKYIEVEGVISGDAILVSQAWY